MNLQNQIPPGLTQCSFLIMVYNKSCNLYKFVIGSTSNIYQSILELDQLYCSNGKIYLIGYTCANQVFNYAYKDFNITNENYEYFFSINPSFKIIEYIKICKLINISEHSNTKSSNFDENYNQNKRARYTN